MQWHQGLVYVSIIWYFSLTVTSDQQRKKISLPSAKREMGAVKDELKTHVRLGEGLPSSQSFFFFLSFLQCINSAVYPWVCFKKGRVLLYSECVYCSNVCHSQFLSGRGNVRWHTTGPVCSVYCVYAVLSLSTCMASLFLFFSDYFSWSFPGDVFTVALSSFIHNNIVSVLFHS